MADRPVYLGDDGILRAKSDRLQNAYAAQDGPKALTTAENNLASVVIPANYLAAGETFQFEFSALQVNTTVASTILVYVKVNATRVATLTMVVGTTANPAPGRAMRVAGSITFKTIGVTGTADAELAGSFNSREFLAAVSAAPTVVNTTTPVTLSVGYCGLTGVATTTVSPRVIWLVENA